MKRYLSRLPCEIIQHIIGYTLQPQSSDLCKDIHSYIKSRRHIMYLYDQFWTVDMGDCENKYKNWLANDIVSYINNQQGTMYGFVDNFYNVFYRNLQLKNSEYIECYFNKLESNSVDTEINILWGLLLPEERDHIISIFPDGPIFTENTQW